MLADEANMQKQKKREEQLKRWREREMMSETSSSSTIEAYESAAKSQKLMSTTTTTGSKKESKVKFPKGCVFLAACSSGDTDEVRQHLKMGVNINTTNIDGLTALHQACIDANLDMVKFLVENQADINAQDNEGWTPLHAAVSVGNLEVAKYLINKGARLNVCNNDSDLPIDLCDSTNTQMKEFLDEEMKRQSIDAEFEKSKEEMIMYEDAKEMNFLDKIHQKTGATPLHVSAAKGYLRVIKLLIEYGANVNEVDKDGWTPLHAAAHWEQEEACKILAENGADFEIKSYSGQTPYDVCDKEMGAKLRMLQNKQQSSANLQKEKANELNPLNNNRLEARNRKPSDEYNKSSSITRLTNEAKSSISDREKKQDKILLSPISSSNKPQFDLFINSDNETDKSNKPTNENEPETTLADNRELNNHLKTDDDRFTSDKENIDRSKANYTNSTTSATTNNSQTQQSLEQQQDKPLVLNKSNNLNKSKTGLQESLKSLSAQVKLKMDEDKEEINEKNISANTNNVDMNGLCGHSSTNGTSMGSTNLNGTNANDKHNNILTSGTGGAGGGSGSGGSPVLTSTSTSTLSPSNSSNLINSSTTSYSSFNKDGTRPYLERRWGNSTSQNETSTYRRRVGLPGSNLTQSPIGSPVSNDSQNPASPNSLAANPADPTRRYSTAPIASKDEQAELIRKQKAKLERHFRRSTQAVSYEDIKSAEATIKGSSLNSPNPSLNEPSTPSGVDSPSVNGPIVPSSTSSTTTFNFNNTGQILTTVPINSPPISQQGVSSLSSIFGESITKNVSSNNLHGLSNQLSAASSTSLSSTTSSTNTAIGSSLGGVPSSTVTATTPTASTTNATSLNNNSTSATTSGAAGSTNESNEKDAIIANDIETDKLLTVIEKSKGFSDTYSTTRRLRNRAIPFGSFQPSFNNVYNDRFSAKTQSLIDESQPSNSKKEDEKPTLDSTRQSSQIQQNNNDINNTTNNNNNQGLTIDVSQSNTSNQAQSQSRPMYRFGQGENNVTGANSSYSNLNNLANSTPTTTNTTTTTSSNPSSAFNTNMNNNNNNNSRSAIKRSVSQVPSTDRRNLNTNGLNNNASNELNSFDGKNIDFQAAYELMKKENEQLNQTILKMQKELDEQNKKLQNVDTLGLDKREKRAFDRRISELEEEVKKVENLKQDNIRLKEENAALIRVISKLSK